MQRGAVLIPAALTILTSEFAEAKRPRAMAVYNGAGQACAVVAPAFGGICAEFLNWRWAFFVNVPIGLAGLVLLTRAAPANPRHAGRAAGPLLDLRVLRVPGFSAAAVVLCALGFSMTLATVYGAVSLQVALHLSPAQGGAALLLLVVPLLIVTLGIARGSVRHDARRLGVVGSLLLSVGSLMVGVGLGRAWLPLVVVGLVPCGAGIAVLLSPITVAALALAPSDRRGQAGALVAAGRQLAGVVGIGAATLLVAQAGARAGAAVVFCLAALVMLASARVACGLPAAS